MISYVKSGSKKRIISKFAGLKRHSMKILFATMIMAMVSATGSAQDVVMERNMPAQAAEESPSDTIPETVMTYAAPHIPYYEMPEACGAAIGSARSDSLHLPVLSTRGQVMPVSMYHVWPGFWNSWQLHEGLNLSLGTAVTAQFGKNAPHGVAFSQNISAMYAIPLNGKLSIAMGGYFNNTYWQHDRFGSAGLTALLGYKFNERWEAYVYGQMSIAENRMMPYPLGYMNGAGNRIGTALKYNFNDNSSIQISIEGCSRQSPRRMSVRPPEDLRMQP